MLLHLKTQFPNAIFTNARTFVRVLMLICCKFKYHIVNKKKLNQNVLLTNINTKKNLNTLLILKGSKLCHFLYDTFL
jgi:hypothetical protein